MSVDALMIIDALMIAASAIGLNLYWIGVPLPYRSYGGRMTQDTYFMPLAVLGLYKAIYWTIGTDMHVGYVWHVLVPFFLGTGLMFFTLAIDPEQCGPGVFIAFVGGAISSLAVPLLSSFLIQPWNSKAALLITEAGVPAVVGIWWTLGRLMHSD